MYVTRLKNWKDVTQKTLYRVCSIDLATYMYTNLETTARSVYVTVKRNKVTRQTHETLPDGQPHQTLIMPCQKVDVGLGLKNSTIGKEHA